LEQGFCTVNLSEGRALYYFIVINAEALLVVIDA
jgi:hypothetical protein